MSGFRIGKVNKQRVFRSFRKLSPIQAVESLVVLSPEQFLAEGKKLILLDVDNTLLPWRSEDIPQDTINWIARAKSAGLELCILSNTRHPARLERLSSRMGVRFIRGRFKPNPAIYLQALAEFHVEPDEAVMIGDQLFTDVLGANRAGIEAIWVKPMTRRDFIGTKVSRLGEKLIRGIIYRGIDTQK